MAKESRIKFNPTTKEMEISGTEKFVKTYFKKLQQLISGDDEPAPRKKRGRKPGRRTATKATKTVAKKSVVKKVAKAASKKVPKLKGKKEVQPTIAPEVETKA